eukprot:GFKZ01014886.1.p1 GENE.GFKZ01014886.1~~GFKZ01014886.1.p1  ORF type:complete len:348 (-),score=62.99 GFKZ01014886.1:1763-2770(-)
MEDRDDPMWEGLGSIDAFISSPTHTPSSPSSTWQAWGRPLLPSVLQVRLDGEPAEDSPDLDLLLPSLPVASGRIEKPIPPPPPPSHPPPASVKKEKIKIETNLDPSSVVTNDPVPQIANHPLHHQPPPLPPRPHPPPPPQPSHTLIQKHPARTPHRPITHHLPQPQPHQHPIQMPVQSAPAPTTVKPVVVRKVHASADVEPAISLKEKREREARQFPKEILGNLDGTTSAEVRKMNATERELVLYKRKLRNRESARRSRQKRQATLAELQEEVDDLMQVTGRMVEVGISLHEENVKLRDRLALANKEVARMRTVFGENDADPSRSTAALKMKLGG